jgi:mannose-1-phosphate guanylyltransferase
LAGGESRRLFPLNTPKPLLKVRGKSLLRLTLDRVKGTKRYVILNPHLLKAVREDLKSASYSDVKFVLEPAARDTAAAISFGIKSLEVMNPQFVLILSSDQFFPDPKPFRSWLSKALDETLEHPECIFLAGIDKKNIAEETYSQFGWMQTGRSSRFSRPVLKFIEKPKGRRLQDFVHSRAFVNGGIFFARYSVLRESIRKSFPEGLGKRSDFKSLPNKSFDRSVIQKSRDLRMLPLAGGWQDIGTWPSVSRHLGGHRFLGAAARDCFVFNDSKLDIYCLGVKDLTIVSSGKRILICSHDAALKMKQLLGKLRVLQ